MQLPILKRVFAGLLGTALYIGIFLFFMSLFTPGLIKQVVIEGMPAADHSWLTFQLWALQEFWQFVLITTLFAVHESTTSLIRLEPIAFLRPWALIAKMFVIMIIANFSYSAWAIVPLVAVLQFPEDFITRYAPKHE